MNRIKMVAVSGVLSAVFATAVPATATAAGAPTDPSTTSGTLTPQQLGAAKAAADSNPNDKSKDGWGFRNATATETKAKADYMAALIKGKSGTLQPAITYPNPLMLSNHQQGQWYNNYCGPATAVEALSQFYDTRSGVTVHDQGYWASQFGISPNNGGTGNDVMVAGLNANDGKFPYIRVNLAYSPTATDTATFEDHLKGDTYYASAPIIGNSMEVYNGPHLVGHPNSPQTLYHWFDFQGYDQDWAAYLDSATTVWGSVPPRSGMPDSTLVTIMGGRGYLW